MNPVMLALMMALAGAPAGGAAAGAADAPDARTRAEAKIAELSRAALRTPDAIETWATLSRALRSLRPAALKDVPTAAERAALRYADSLAATTPGALTEVRIEERDGRTEIAVRATGDVRYRLFRRLADPVDPRLTLEIYDARPALLAPRYPRIDRGGVRELRVTQTDSGTVQVAISLEGPRVFGVVERGGEIVVWLRNVDGAFAPWRSRPTWARGEPEPFDAALAAEPVEPATAAPLPLAAMQAAPAASEPASDAAADAALPALRPAVAAALRPDAQAAGARTAADGLARLVPGVPQPAAAVERLIAAAGGLDPRAAGLGVALLLLAAAGVAVVRARPRRPRRSPARALASMRPAAAERAPASPREARLWTVRTLAARGASEAEIARTTGLSQDAVALIVRSLDERSEAAASAAPGTFFRSAGGAQPLAMAGAR